MSAWALALPSAVLAQEAGAGFELRTTLTGEGAFSRDLTTSPREGAPVTGGFRALLYPTLKLDDHWSFSGAMQVMSRPFFPEQFESQGYGVKGDLLRAHLTYTRLGKNKSLVIRAGILSSEFGSFLLRYDDFANPLLGLPQTYGYYYTAVTTLGLAGVQADATAGHFDMRAQFVNSSPANRRSIFDSDQYGNWAGGAGYTIRQGFRVGGSAYRGPYLHKDHPDYLPGEASPRRLAASGLGIDAEWGGGPWNVRGELQWFRMAHQIVPTETQQSGYIEARRVLAPRWYVAARAGYWRSSDDPSYRTYETAIGFRPNSAQLIKIGYTIQNGPAFPGTTYNTLAVQVVTTFRPISIARD